MSHDIIDNRTDKLIDHIRRILPGSQAARFAVGYFSLSELKSVASLEADGGKLPTQRTANSYSQRQGNEKWTAGKQLSS